MISFRRILSTVLERALSSGEAEPYDASDRFSVAAKPTTRAFIERQASALRTSVSAVAGMILDEVVDASSPDEGLSMRAIAGRLRQLIAAHGISMPAAAEFLRPLGIGAKGELADDHLLYPLLTPGVLSGLGKMFAVQYEWLVGLEESPIRATVLWDKRPAVALQRVLDAAKQYEAVQLVVVVSPLHPVAEKGARSRGSGRGKQTTDRNQTLLFLGRRQSLEADLETLMTYECWTAFPWEYERTRVEGKLLFRAVDDLVELKAAGFHGEVEMRGVVLPSEQFDALANHQVLPASLLSGGRIDWHPCDYVEPSSACALDPEEWAQIVSHPGHAQTLKELRKLISEAGAK